VGGGFAARKYIGTPVARSAARLNYQRRKLGIDTSGLETVMSFLVPWGRDASLEEISRAWDRLGYRSIVTLDQSLDDPRTSDETRLDLLLKKAALDNYEGEPQQAYEVLQQLRALVESNDAWAKPALYTVIYYQGLTALRRGETENCIMCRGESS